MKRLIIFIFLYAASQNVEGQTSDTIAIENVNVIPMTEEVVLRNQRVLISKGKIVKIEPASSPRRHEATITISGTGKYLIPGLSEMHYHFRSNDIESDMKLFIANGITTVRNMAEWDGQNHMEIKHRTLSGELPHLNYFTTGPYLTAKDLPTIGNVVEVVKTHKEKGYDFLKIADNLPEHIYLKLLEEGQNNSVPIIGHAQRNQPLEYSLRMKSIEHIEEFLYLSSDSQGNSFYKSGTSDLTKLSLQVKKSGIYIGTTLSVFKFINDCLDDKKFAALQENDLVRYLAKKEREAFLTENNDYRKLRTREFDGVRAVILFGDYYLWIKHFAQMLSDVGVPLLTGSDTYGMVIVGFSLHQEFELLQESGIKPFDILLASTVNPARYLNTYASEGTVTEGKNANLVLLNKNPLDDIRNTTLIEGVLLRGEWFDRRKINSMLKEVEQAFK
jgi:Amidohydrolase family